MESFIKAMDELPLWAKIVLAIPMLDVIWAVYRILKSVSAKNVLGIVLGAVCALFAAFPVAIFDIIYLAVKKESVWWID